jgi:hypothetical protein
MSIVIGAAASSFGLPRPRLTSSRLYGRVGDILRVAEHAWSGSRRGDAIQLGDQVRDAWVSVTFCWRLRSNAIAATVSRSRP